MDPVMTTPHTSCPCGCGRLLPLSRHQAHAIAVDRATPDLDLAVTYGLSISQVKHLRIRSRGT